ncbi:MAG: outer membrane beta-barrel protein [Woeseiaceae bacterium]|nr:outer membrane beta-barrel protein [Woeseiaceae bacterium]
MRTILIALSLFLAGAASAQAPSQPSLDYSYLEGRYVDLDVGGGDGFRFGGSYQLNGNWILLGSLTTLDFDFDVDSFTIDVGGGYIIPFQKDWDFLATLRYVNTEVDTPFGDADDSGLGISFGIRGMIAPQFEVRGNVNHVTIGDDDTFLDIAADYYFTPQFAAGLSVDIGGDADAFTIGGRWYFR